MKNRTVILMLVFYLVICLSTAVCAQDVPAVELDGSALTAGQPFRFTVTVNSDEYRSFADAQTWLTAVLCPLGGDLASCQTLSMSTSGEDSTSIRVTFSANALPYAGDYSLTVSFTDTTGNFASQSVSYLLRGVQTAAPAEIPPAVQKISLTPALQDSAGNNLVYGSTLYVGDAYDLQVQSDTSLDDRVTLQIAFPASLAAAPVDPASGCLSFLNWDRTALEIPGSYFSADRGNTFTCELRFADSTWIAAQPVRFSLIENAVNAAAADVRYEMDPLDWSYYPVNITKKTATHQIQISDSRGNLICSDTVPCGYFNAEDVYMITYKFPADWSAPLTSGMDLTASVTWPEDWAQFLMTGTDSDLASVYGYACTVDWEGKSTLQMTETDPGRYSASCTFVPSGISNPRSVPASVHLNDNSWQLSDLSVYLPGTIVKSQAVLTPMLSLRMSSDDGDANQISGGIISGLYRTTRDYPNGSGDSSAPVMYSLQARVDGISASRTPQAGDVVRVTWNVLDSLALTGDLPSCLVPSGNGYDLGQLYQAEDGSWQASCDFWFPRTMPESTPGGRLDIQLLSGVYQTSAYASMNGTAFKKETLRVNMEVPTHPLLNQQTIFRASLTDSAGNYSDYMRAVLADSAVTLTSDWNYNFLTDCQGYYIFSEDGVATCSAYFEQPNGMESDIHYDLVTGLLDDLFSVAWSPSADFHIQEVTEVSAELSVKLFHSGTEVPLPTSEAFIVGDDYQLQFWLTPDADFSSVLNAVSVDEEGLVLDWWDPLTVYWGMLPGGMTSLGFIRDGDHFISRYDFSFMAGDISLDYGLNQLTVMTSINGWDIRLPNDGMALELPDRVDRKALSLDISDFTVFGSDETVSDLFVDQTAEFTIGFNGSFDSFDPYGLAVTYETDGIETPLVCMPDYGSSAITCSIQAVCTDYSGSYSSVCGSPLTIHASYAGDAVNGAAEADPKTFSIKRNGIVFSSAAEGSLNKDDLQKIQIASDDLMYMTDASVTVNGWGVDTYLPRRVWDAYSSEYRSYPVVFNYTVQGDAIPDQSLFRLDVTYETGSRTAPVENKVSLSPVMVTDDTVYFELNFGSMEILDDGRMVQEALKDAVTITALTVRYTGDSLIGSSSARYEAEDVTFALKIADFAELDIDSGMSGTLQFSGTYTADTIGIPLTVYCTQLSDMLECAADLPELEYDENGELIETSFADDGCWGGIQLSPGVSTIFTSNAWTPICYLIGWNDGSIFIAANMK